LALSTELNRNENTAMSTLLIQLPEPQPEALERINKERNLAVTLETMCMVACVTFLCGYVKFMCFFFFPSPECECLMGGD
jgi:hypothetical protein